MYKLLDDVVINTGSDADVTVGGNDDDEDVSVNGAAVETTEVDASEVDTAAVVDNDAVLNEPAATYPASDEDRIGVTTDEGTDPVATDQGDEQNDAVIWGTPDAPGADHDYPPKDEDDRTGTTIV